jgi:hypothetical protein
MNFHEFWKFTEYLNLALGWIRSTATMLRTGGPLERPSPRWGRPWRPTHTVWAHPGWLKGGWVLQGLGATRGCHAQRRNNGGAGSSCVQAEREWGWLGAWREGRGRGPRLASAGVEAGCNERRRGPRRGAHRGASGPSGDDLTPMRHTPDEDGGEANRWAWVYLKFHLNPKSDPTLIWSKS